MAALSSGHGHRLIGRGTRPLPGRIDGRGRPQSSVALGPSTVPCPIRAAGSVGHHRLSPRAPRTGPDLSPPPDLDVTTPDPSVCDQVIAVVRSVPAGYVTTYGDIAHRLGLRTPRQVGAVLARGTGSAPWHRVIHADGTLVQGLVEEQSHLLRSEGVKVVGGRVSLKEYRW